MMRKKGLSWKTALPGLILAIIVLAVVLGGAMEPAEGMLGDLNETGDRGTICQEYEEIGCCTNGPDRCTEIEEQEWNDDWGEIDAICCRGGTGPT